MSLFDELSGLIVSCQASPGSPLDDPDVLARIALAACAGGATAIRANNPDNVRAIASAVPVPVIGLHKRDVPGSDVRITPTFEDAAGLAETGCMAIAIDATLRQRPDGGTAAELIERVRSELQIAVLADVDCLDAGRVAAEAGAHAIATTLAGYTEVSPVADGPDIKLVRELVNGCSTPVFGEGRYTTPAHVAAAMAAGARGVIVGTAITAPSWIAAQFAASALAAPAHNAGMSETDAGRRMPLPVSPKGVSDNETGSNSKDGKWKN